MAVGLRDRLQIADCNTEAIRYLEGTGSLNFP
jgi:hypothetical protein